MKQKLTSKVLRAVLIAAVLVIGLASSDTLDKSSCVFAKDCYEAMDDYFNANSTYEIACVSYFYGQPTTCQQECQGNPNPTQCINDCQINRQTALGNAEIGLFSLAMDTCTPLALEQCAEARSMADACSVQHPYLDYSDLDERLAVYQQYSACREASKIDTCQ